MPKTYTEDDPYDLEQELDEEFKRVCAKQMHKILINMN